jgi:predicted DsbA family dithiol-disulfide isomerase
LADVSVVHDVNSLHFLLSLNNNSDSKCDDCVALKSHLQEALSELKSVKLIIKLLQETCNKNEEIKPNDVNNLTNSDQNTSEIISNK